jgi:hypothetical protein
VQAVSLCQPSPPHWSQGLKSADTSLPRLSATKTVTDESLDIICELEVNKYKSTMQQNSSRDEPVNPMDLHETTCIYVESQEVHRRFYEITASVAIRVVEEEAGGPLYHRCLS